MRKDVSCDYSSDFSREFSLDSPRSSLWNSCLVIYQQCSSDSSCDHSRDFFRNSSGIFKKILSECLRRFQGKNLSVLHPRFVERFFLGFRPIFPQGFSWNSSQDYSRDSLRNTSICYEFFRNYKNFYKDYWKDISWYFFRDLLNFSGISPEIPLGIVRSFLLRSFQGILKEYFHFQNFFRNIYKNFYKYCWKDFYRYSCQDMLRILSGISHKIPHGTRYRFLPGFLPEFLPDFVQARILLMIISGTSPEISP